MVLTLAIWAAWLAAERRWSPVATRWVRYAAAAAAVQVTLGIATLLLSVPVSIAVAHQLGAVALLTVLLVGAERVRG